MMHGKVQNALRYLCRKTAGGVLSLDDLLLDATGNGNQPCTRTTHDILLEKHPQGAPPMESFLLRDTPEPVNRIVFDNLDPDAIHQAAMRTNGAAGLSGLDAYAWRCLCSSYGANSRNLYSTLAAVGCRICSGHVHPDGLSCFVACRLIPLDKCPSVRPIGVEEVPRRILAKAVLRIVGPNVEEAAGPLQVCATHRWAKCRGGSRPSPCLCYASLGQISRRQQVLSRSVPVKTEECARQQCMPCEIYFTTPKRKET